VTTTPVALEAIQRCFLGVIPSPVATVSADGTPNITHMSIVQYVDSERVALSRQFFRKTAQNLEENPYAQVMVVDPNGIQQYLLDLRYLHTETSGPIFETMRANLEGMASHSGVGSSVFRLRGVDLYDVERCTAVRDEDTPDRGPTERDLLKALDAFVARLGACEDYAEATEVALQSLEDLFGFPHAMLLISPEGVGDRLFGMASNGYDGSPAGAEVAFGDGLIGVAAQRRRVVFVANVMRERIMAGAVVERAAANGRSGAAREIPLPGLPGVQSAAAVPLVLHGQLDGVLYLESESAGGFGAHNESLLRIIAGHLAAALSALDRDQDEAPEVAPVAMTAPVASTDALELTYYQADDSVFAGGDYVIKGVPGRILWKLARDFATDGRTAFSNRELRLDEQLGLPAGNDNLEARLVALRRRLEAGGWGIALERVARGRLELRVQQPLALVEVPTHGPMRAAHTAR
jgi:adenylate cyclase